jgi:hypothetical protein
MHIESYGFPDGVDSTGALHDMKSGTWFVDNSDPRYEGLNRAQRRKAMAVEARAFRKRNKQRG